MTAEDRTQKRIEDLEKRVRTHPQDQELSDSLVRAYMSAGRHIQAADALEARIAATSPADWDVVTLCCETCLRGGRPDRGHALLSRLEEQFGSNAFYWILRGHMLEEMGKLNEARAEHERAIALDPTNAEAVYRCGVTQMKAKHDSDAIQLFERCLALDPKMTKAQINIGVLLDQMGQPERAIEAFRHAIEANPSSVESYCNLGAAYGDLGRNKEAIAEFQRALEIDSDCAMAHFNLGLALMESSPEDAMTSLKRAQTLDPGNWDINYNLGWIYFRKGMYDVAARLLQQCVQARPDSVQALYYLGVTYNKKDQPGQAIECFNRLLDLDPQNSQAHFYLGVAYDKKGQWEKARMSYQAADRLRNHG